VCQNSKFLSGGGVTRQLVLHERKGRGGIPRRFNTQQSVHAPRSGSEIKDGAPKSFRWENPEGGELDPAVEKIGPVE